MIFKKKRSGTASMLTVYARDGKKSTPVGNDRVEKT
jgi:hypothetical protein